MSDIFDQMMNRTGSATSASPQPSPSTGGRPLHENWEGFTKVHVNGKVAAKCHVCSHTLLSIEYFKSATDCSPVFISF